MKILNLSGRRYRRLRTRVPVNVRPEGVWTDMTTHTVDVSTGGAAFDVPAGRATCAVGDRVSLRVDLGPETEPFHTVGRVRHLTVIAPYEGEPIAMRMGVQFRDALLLSRVPCAGV